MTYDPFRVTPIGLALIAAAIVAEVALMALGLWWLAGLTLPAIVPWFVSTLDQWIASKRSDCYVYGLICIPEQEVDPVRVTPGRLAYVGQSADFHARMLRHTNPATWLPGENWKAEIVGVVILTWCRNDKQMDRVEKRRIVAMAEAERLGRCDEVHNDRHSLPAKTAGGLLWRRFWARVYQIESVVWPDHAWDGNRYWTRIRPVSLDEEPEPEDGEADVGPAPRRPFALLAGPTEPDPAGGESVDDRPVTDSAAPETCHASRVTQETPVGGPADSVTRDSPPDRSVTGSFAERLAALQPGARPAPEGERPPRKRAKSGPPSPTRTPEEQDERRRALARARTAKKRALAAGRPWPPEDQTDLQ